jgi:hypothetical protein
MGSVSNSSLSDLSLSKFRFLNVEDVVDFKYLPTPTDSLSFVSANDDNFVPNHVVVS